MKQTILIISFFFVLNISADYINTDETYIDEITSLGMNSGDIVFKTKNLPPGCAGFWIHPEDRGAKNNLSILLTAKTTNSKVIITSIDDVDKRWNGSGAPYYRLYKIILK